ncbi:MAG: (2Fe-2S)-binding protein [Gammaproteobacteria bacterium]|nr:(2Fe-2S)-binding protein [Gammaproteobacteria bacterium]
MNKTITVTVNGVDHTAEVPLRMLLVDFIRDTLGLTGTHQGCTFEGVCGACTVHLNGEAIKSCMMLAVQADGQALTTIEGVAAGDELHAVQKAFREHHGLQCGYCTSGMIMNAVEFLRVNPDPSEEEVRHALIGNICRCTGYQNIVVSVLAAAKELAQT